MGRRRSALRSPRSSVKQGVRQGCALRLHIQGARCAHLQPGLENAELEGFRFGCGPRASMRHASAARSGPSDRAQRTTGPSEGGDAAAGCCLASAAALQSGGAFLVCGVAGGVSYMSARPGTHSGTVPLGCGCGGAFWRGGDCAAARGICGIRSRGGLLKGRDPSRFAGGGLGGGSPFPSGGLLKSCGDSGTAG